VSSECYQVSCEFNQRDSELNCPASTCTSESATASSEQRVEELNHVRESRPVSAWWRVRITVSNGEFNHGCEFNHVRSDEFNHVGELISARRV
jgi:hypothetical protein